MLYRLSLLDCERTHRREYFYKPTFLILPLGHLGRLPVLFQAQLMEKCFILTKQGKSSIKDNECKKNISESRHKVRSGGRELQEICNVMYVKCGINFNYRTYIT